MNKLTFALISLVAMVSTATAQAADLNVGFVNVQRLLADAPQAKSSMQALQDEFAPRLLDNSFNGP
jgi:outer membrane protein